MELKIKGQPVECTLDKEETAFDVVQSLVTIVNDVEAIVASVDVDGQVFSIEDPELKNISVNEIKVLDIDLAKKNDLILELIGEAKNILANIAADLKENGFTHVAEFNELFGWINETIQTINSLSFFNMVEAKLMVSTVQQIVDYLNSEQKDPSKIGSLSGILQSLVQYLEAMELKISSNFAVTEKDVRDAISSTVELLPEISESFQTGKDREALEKINRIVSVLELCCIYIKKNFAAFSESQRDEIDSLYEDINSLLTQIVSAFENGDVVLLGDLLEYELPGKFENYKNIILGD